MARTVLIPRSRIERWVANFEQRHGEVRLGVAEGALSGTASDGSWFRARPPFGAPYDGEPSGAGLAKLALPPDWGVLLVRKGGFAIARLHGSELTESKVGQRHVQGRTKAGGQSQQRFARRRDNQARQAFEAAGTHAARILTGVPLLVTGGDRAAVMATISEAGLTGEVVAPWLAVPDPRRSILDQSIAQAQSIAIEVHNS